MTSPVLRLPADTTDPEVGARACLALVNTVHWRRGDAPTETLTSYDALLGAVAGVLPPAAAAPLRAAAAADPVGAAQALDRAVRLRESVHGVFAAVAAGASPPAAAQEELDRWVHGALRHLRLDGRDLRLLPSDDVEVPARHAALSAAALLTSGPLERVRACPGPTCGWLFVDTTRNGSRRWCDPAQCGNRERVRAHYRRSHGHAPAGNADAG